MPYGNRLFEYFTLIVLPVIRRITIQQQIRITFQRIYQQTVQNAILLNRAGVLQNSISMMPNIFLFIQVNMPESGTIASIAIQIQTTLLPIVVSFAMTIRGVE